MVPDPSFTTQMFQVPVASFLAHRKRHAGPPLVAVHQTVQLFLTKGTLAK